MRRILLLSAAAVLIAAAAKAQKESNQVIEGNGKASTREVPVSSFESLKASGVYELRLSQGGSEGVKIEADENLQPYFNVHNEGRQLVIEMKDVKNKNLKPKTKLRVYVSFKSLKEMNLNMVGNVKADGPLHFDALTLDNKSVGNIDLDLTASTLTLKNSSVGNVHLHGKASQATVNNSGVGSLDAGSFAVEKLRISNSGVGNAEVNAEKELNVTENMLGRVRNRGAAPVKKSNRVEI